MISAVPQRWLLQVLPLSKIRLFGLRLVDQLHRKASPCFSLHRPTVNAKFLITGYKNGNDIGDTASSLDYHYLWRPFFISLHYLISLLSVPSWMGRWICLPQYAYFLCYRGRSRRARTFGFCQLFHDKMRSLSDDSSHL